MASQVALAIACDKACERIEEWAARNVSKGLTPLPRLHRDRDILRKIQLETIADWLDRANGGQSDDMQSVIAMVTSANWTKQELIDLVSGQADGSDS